MNKTIYKYILTFIIGILFCSNGFAIQQTTVDSLQIDTSTVTPKKFEDLKEKYNGEEFIYERTIENSGWWSRFKRWFNNFINELFGLKNEGQASSATDVFIKIAGVILFLLVAYFIFRAIINKEGNWVFGKSSDRSIIPVTDIENNIHIVNFETLIKDAENDQNKRLAIRYYYLWLLKDLSEKGLIEYDVEKTNSDYALEVASTNIETEFSYTSYLYNYIWYGEFEIDNTQYQNAKDAFINLLKSVKA